jgi:hypothetical protein
LAGWRVVPVEGAKVAFSVVACTQNIYGQGEDLPPGIVVDIIPIREMGGESYSWNEYYNGIHFYAVHLHGEIEVDYGSFYLAETCLMGLEPE